MNLFAPSLALSKDDWLDKFFGNEIADAANETIYGNLADPDSDGLPNLLEFALNTDPTTSSVSPLAVTLAATLPSASPFRVARRPATSPTASKPAMISPLGINLEPSLQSQPQL